MSGAPTPRHLTGVTEHTGLSQDAVLWLGRLYSRSHRSYTADAFWQWYATARWSQRAISAELGVFMSTILRLSRDAGFRPAEPPYDAHTVARFFELTATLRALPMITPRHITLEAIGREQGMRVALIKSHFEAHPHLGVIRTYRKPRSRPAEAVTRASYARYKRWLPPYAPADWMTVYALTILLGHSHNKIKRFIRDQQLESRELRAPNGEITDHYPVEPIVAGLGRRQPAPPAGDWLTIKRASAGDWGLRRWLAKHADPAAGGMRQNDSGLDCQHYPPDYLNTLIARYPAPAGKPKLSA